jgi:DNA-binding FadR family transcriptional regulator
MPLQAIRAQSLSDQVFEQLASEILSGRYQAGANLPAERAMTVVFKVNRHVVREALKRLEQAGLVKITQGGGTTVVDFKRHAGLDLLALMSEHARGGEDVASIWLSVLEMRAAIAADLARLCAARGAKDLKDELLAISDKMRTASDDQNVFALEVRFWERVVDGADNIAYRFSLNSMLKAVNTRGEQARQWSLFEVKESDYRGPIARAIASGDPLHAETTTRDAMRAVVEAFAASLGKGTSAKSPRRRRR